MILTSPTHFLASLIILPIDQVQSSFLHVYYGVVAYHFLKTVVMILFTELYDEWALAGANDLEMQDQPEEVGFALKYIGSTLVESATSEAATADAVKAILNLSKAAGKKMSRVNLAVSTRGIKVTNLSTNELQLEVSIYRYWILDCLISLLISIFRISYCSADAAHSQVFAFIATNPNETLECHAFLCPKRKVVSLTELWQFAI